MYEKEEPELTEEQMLWSQWTMAPEKKPGDFAIYTAAIVLITATIQFVTVSGI